jgi:hypothetical protein
MITFDYDIPSTKTFFFSQEIYNTLQNLYIEQYTNQAEEQFDDYIEDEYTSELNRISNLERRYELEEEDIYDDVYNKTYDREMSKVADAEYVLEQLGGYVKPKLYNRTRKLRRIMK